MVITGPQKQTATFGVRAAGCVTLFWLVGAEATGNLVLRISCSAWRYHPPPGWGPQFCRRTQRYCYAYFLSRNQDPTSRLNYHLIVPPLFLYPLPSLISNCLNLSFRTQGRSRRLNEAYVLQTRNGEDRADLYSRVPWILHSFNSGNWTTLALTTSCQNGGIMLPSVWRIDTELEVFEFQVLDVCLVWLKPQSLGVPFCCNRPN